MNNANKQRPNEAVGSEMLKHFVEPGDRSLFRQMGVRLWRMAVRMRMHVIAVSVRVRMNGGILSHHRHPTPKAAEVDNAQHDQHDCDRKVHHQAYTWADVELRPAISLLWND